MHLLPPRYPTPSYHGMHNPFSYTRLRQPKYDTREIIFLATAKLQYEIPNMRVLNGLRSSVMQGEAG